MARYRKTNDRNLILLGQCSTWGIDWCKQHWHIYFGHLRAAQGKNLYLRQAADIFHLDLLFLIAFVSTDKNCYNGVLTPSALIIRDHSGYGLGQWEKALHSNASSHWISPYPEWSLIMCICVNMNWIIIPGNGLHLFSAKPLPEPVLTYFTVNLPTVRTTLSEILIKKDSFIQENYCKFCMQNLTFYRWVKISSRELKSCSHEISQKGYIHL